MEPTPIQENQRLREERDLLRRRLAELEDDFARSNQEIFAMNEALVSANSRLSELDRMKQGREQEGECSQCSLVQHSLV